MNNILKTLIKIFLFEKCTFYCSINDALASTNFQRYDGTKLKHERTKSTYLSSHNIMAQHSKYFNSLQLLHDNISMYSFKIKAINASYNMLETEAYYKRELLKNVCIKISA